MASSVASESLASYNDDSKQFNRPFKGLLQTFITPFNGFLKASKSFSFRRPLKNLYIFLEGLWKPLKSLQKASKTPLNAFRKLVTGL